MRGAPQGSGSRTRRAPRLHPPSKPVPASNMNVLPTPLAALPGTMQASWRGSRWTRRTASRNGAMTSGVAGGRGGGRRGQEGRRGERREAAGGRGKLPPADANWLRMPTFPPPPPPRPDYKRLSLLKQQYPDTPLLALTATATQRVCLCMYRRTCVCRGGRVRVNRGEGVCVCDRGTHARTHPGTLHGLAGSTDSWQAFPHKHWIAATKHSKWGPGLGPLMLQADGGPPLPPHTHVCPLDVTPRCATT